MLGLGSIIGTGVFVSLGLAAGVAGPAVIPAIALAALIAGCNALSSAQLAASHPVSGGSYEYGYRYLSPPLGFSAGWLFLCAKTASAATAALGFSGYLILMAGWPPAWRGGIAVLLVGLLTGVVLAGARVSSRANSIAVSITIAALVCFAVAALPQAIAEGAGRLADFSGTPAEATFWPSLLQATALMFVSFTGYGRIATLGEEVEEPRRSIPRAILAALWVSAALYILVGLAAVAAVGAAQLGSYSIALGAPLAQAAGDFGLRWAGRAVSLGALTAMLGVLLNLILGLSRVLMAMGRRGDMPEVFSRLNSARSAPPYAVLAMGLAVAAIAGLGSIKAAWSFSAFSVLAYYAITNLCALRLAAAERLYARWLAWAGLAACLFIAFWVESRYWLIGLGLLGLGLIWHFAAQALRRRAEA